MKNKITVIEIHEGFIVSRNGFTKTYFTPFKNRAIEWFLKDEESQ